MKSLPNITELKKKKIKLCLALESCCFVKLVIPLNAKRYILDLGTVNIPDLAYVSEIQTITTSNINDFNKS